MRARVQESDEQIRIKDQRHGQDVLAIKNQLKFIRSQKDALKQNEDTMMLLQRQIQANETQLAKSEAHINQLVTENEKVIGRLIEDKTKMQVRTIACTCIQSDSPQYV